MRQPHVEALPWIEKFVATSPAEMQSFFTFSCDLVALAEMRFKFYFAETVVTFARMADMDAEWVSVWGGHGSGNDAAQGALGCVSCPRRP